MKRTAKDTETKQFHVKLSEFVKLRWLQGHVSRRLKVLMGASMKAPRQRQSTWRSTWHTRYSVTRT